ncbi:MAG: AbrB/MazE/SpoVT family DNA-binding domain-containing protein [Candidatus Korobacteraceae bacterium]
MEGRTCSSSACTGHPGGGTVTDGEELEQPQLIRYAESMSIRNSAETAAVSRIGQRRQVVIPKAVFDALQLREGDFLEMTVERGRLAIQPKRLVDVSEVLTKSEAAKVRQGEAQLKAGRSKPWRTIKHDLGH